MLWKWSRRIGCFFASFVVVLLLCSLSYQFLRTKWDERQYLPLGEMVDIGGYRLHFYRTGSGGPAVILDAGLGDISSDWGLVQPQIAKFTQVISYDRAGTGWSEESPYPRTSQQIVQELHTLLENAKVPKPYILVGHSFGGNNVQLYAMTYPDEVQGIVLVDSCHEEQEKRLPRHPYLQWHRTLMQSPKAVYMMSTLGINRWVFPKYVKVMAPFLPEWMQNRHLALCSSTKHECTVAAELTALEISLGQTQRADHSLIRKKPCIVVTAGRIPEVSKLGISEEFANPVYAVWQDLQKDLVANFENGRQWIAEKSDHMILWHEPELIVEAVKKMCESQRGQDG